MRKEPMRGGTETHVRVSDELEEINEKSIFYDVSRRVVCRVRYCPAKRGD